MNKTLISVAMALTVLAGAGAFATASADEALYQEASPFADRGVTASMALAAGASSASAVNRDEQVANLRFEPRRRWGNVNGNTVSKTDEPE